MYEFEGLLGKWIALVLGRNLTSLIASNAKDLG
jgi:hypothetical protein